MKSQTNEAYLTKVEKLSELNDHIGKEVGLTDWFEITQDQINTFAQTTDDLQWIHVDVQKSKQQSPYKTTIAHGFLILSMASKIVYETLKINNQVMGVNYGLNKVRFINAVPSGAFIRGRVSIIDYKEVHGGGRYILNLVFELKGAKKPACVAEFIAQGYDGEEL